MFKETIAWVKISRLLIRLNSCAYSRFLYICGIALSFGDEHCFFLVESHAFVQPLQNISSSLCGLCHYIFTVT